MLAARFRVSLGIVKKLIQQRRRLVEAGPHHHLAGRKSRIWAAHRKQLWRHLAAKPDLTLAELRVAINLGCRLRAGVWDSTKSDDMMCKLWEYRAQALGWWAISFLLRRDRDSYQLPR